MLSPTNPLGIKAGGEGGTAAAPAVIVSAIVDALKDFGIRDVKMPATPYRIWKLIQDAKAGRGSRGLWESRHGLWPPANLRRHRSAATALSCQRRGRRCDKSEVARKIATPVADSRIKAANMRGILRR